MRHRAELAPAIAVEAALRTKDQRTTGLTREGTLGEAS
jgi:hypothetical protein